MSSDLTNPQPSDTGAGETDLGNFTRFAQGVLPEPDKKDPKTIEDAIRAGDWTAVAKIRLAQIAAFERAMNADVDGDGRANGKKVETPEEAMRRTGSYLDAEGRDPYGYKYYADFGYDRNGNYRDSFGGVLDKEGVYRTEDGAEADLRRSVYTAGPDTYNLQTKEALFLDEKTGKYVLMRKGSEGYAPAEENLSEEEARQIRERWKRENRRLSDAEMKALEEETRRIDEARKHEVESGQSRGPSNSSSVPTSSEASGKGTIGVITGGAIGTVIEATDGLGEAKRRYGEIQRERQAALGRMDEARKSHHSRPAANLKEAGPATAGRWFQDNNVAGGGICNDGYVDEHEGFRAKDGSYLDYKGNFVDKDGNLWLANDKSGKPSFMKQEGVDYMEMLQARAGGPDSYGQWLHADADRAKRLQEVQAGLGTVDEDWKKRREVVDVNKLQYSSRGNDLDKEGNLWIGNALKPLPKRDGVDYLDLLKKAERGKLDDWTKTGDLTKDEIEAIKASIRENEENMRSRGYTFASDKPGSKSKFTPAEKPDVQIPPDPTASSSFTGASATRGSTTEAAGPATEEGETAPQSRRVSLKRPQRAHRVST